MVFASRFDVFLAHSPFRRALGLVCVLVLGAGLTACQPTDDGDGQTSAPPVVEVTARDYAFQVPDTIPSGWVTLQMENRGTEHHHFHLYRLPDGRTHEDFREGHLAPADSARALFKAGERKRALKFLQTSVPDWARLGNLTIRGGMGAVAPGATGRVSARLAPGRYVLVCLIPTPVGVPHFAHGMIGGLTLPKRPLVQSPPRRI